MVGVKTRAFCAYCVILNIFPGDCSGCCNGSKTGSAPEVHHWHVSKNQSSFLVCGCCSRKLLIHASFKFRTNASPSVPAFGKDTLPQRRRTLNNLGITRNNLGNSAVTRISWEQALAISEEAGHFCDFDCMLKRRACRYERAWPGELIHVDVKR